MAMWPALMLSAPSTTALRCPIQRSAISPPNRGVKLHEPLVEAGQQELIDHVEREESHHPVEREALPGFREGQVEKTAIVIGS